MTALLCVQRILYAENVDYDGAVGGVVRHYVSVARGGTPLEIAVHSLLDNAIGMVDMSCPAEYPEGERDAVRSLERMFVAAISKREEREGGSRKRRVVKQPPVVEELDERVWMPEYACATLRFGTPMLVLQFCDDPRFQARINAYIDEHGEELGEDEEFDEEDDEEEEDEDEEDEDEDEDEEDGEGGAKEGGDASGDDAVEEVVPHKKRKIEV